MLGKMMDQPLLISRLIDHAQRYHGATEVVSVETAGGIEITNWASIGANARRVASAMEGLTLAPGARCATLAWNNRRHLEIYFGIPGSGRVCHTLNPRLHPTQMEFIVGDADDKVLFFDRTFLPAVAKIREKLPSVEHFILMGPRDAEAGAAIEGLLFYDEVIAAADERFVWPDLDERTPSSLCYTSGTTGNPKGVLYSHRSTLLHTLVGNQPDGIAISAKDTVLPVVPMFHVNAWGVPYIAAANGAKLVLPGPNLDGKSLVGLIDGHHVTIALGVPTIWLGLLTALEAAGSKAASLTRTVVGGSAMPPSMYAKFRDLYGTELIHAWGMTETSPVATINQLMAKHAGLTEEAKAGIRASQGRPLFGIDLRIVDADGNLLPEDGETPGNLHVRGPWVVETYMGAGKSALTSDGWFDTGDVATIDPDGYMVIRDRAKDIIKSGGEWISTVELENIAIGHPAIANAAAIAARHRKWDERPLLIAIRKAEVSETELLAFYAGKVPQWQVPDRVIFVEELPLGATGKVVKATLRERYGDVLWGEG